jgi:hypothetical protein
MILRIAAARIHEANILTSAVPPACEREVEIKLFSPFDDKSCIIKTFSGRL